MQTRLDSLFIFIFKTYIAMTEKTIDRKNSAKYLVFVDCFKVYYLEKVLVFHC